MFRSGSFEGLLGQLMSAIDYSGLQCESRRGWMVAFWNQNNESNAADESECRSVVEHSGVPYSIPKQSRYNARYQFQQPDGAAVPSDSACSQIFRNKI
jgi:hypothetical protein